MVLPLHNTIGISAMETPAHLIIRHMHTHPVWEFTQLELIVTAANGCIDTLLQEIKMNNVPVADFSFLPATACQGTDIQFTDISTVSGDTIPALVLGFWRWNN